MSKEFNFDWSIFKKKGFEFQNLCSDVFESYGYNIRVMGEGGIDEGRDVIIKGLSENEKDIKLKDVKLLDFNDEEYCWIECKSKINEKSGVAIKEINSNFGFAFISSIQCLIFITNNKFTNQAYNLFFRMNSSNLSPFKIKYIEKNDLEKILKTLPDIYIKYFDKNAKVEDFKFYEKNAELISCEISTNSNFIDEIKVFKLNIKNHSMSEKNISLKSNKNIENIKLSPIENKNLSIPVKDINEIKNFNIEIIENENNSNINLITKYPNIFPIRIDHIYIDTQNNLNNIFDLIDNFHNIYIDGSAGIGKTRLLKEISKSLENDFLWIDLSINNYNTSLLDYLIFKIFKMEKEFLQTFSSDILIKKIQDYKCTKEEAEILNNYLKNESSSINYHFLINIVIKLFEKVFKNKIIFVDNIHNFNILDTKIFEKMLETSNIIICSARGDEIKDDTTRELISFLESKNKLLQIKLSSNNIKEQIINFIEMSSFDKKTKRYLIKYKSSKSFQEFIFSLKTLKAKSIISQKEDGKIILNENIELKLQSYIEIYEDFIKSCANENIKSKIDELLKLSSTFGYTFSVDMIEFILGEEYLELLDDLIIKEFLFESEVESNGSQMLRFDHELTQQIIYNSIPPIKKNKNHKNIIKYFLYLKENSLPFSNKSLSIHYEKVKNFKEAVLYSNLEAKELVKSYQSLNAFEQYKSSIKLIEKLQSNTNKDFYNLEMETLLDLIEIGFDIESTQEIFKYIESAKTITHLEKNRYWEGRIFYFYANYYFKVRNLEKSLEYIKKSELIFEDNKYKLEYAYLLDFYGNLEKNRGEFLHSLLLLRKSIHIFKQIKNYEGLSMAYADFGAVFLESNKGYKTIKWWEKSYDIVRNTKNHVAICKSLIDYSYILALYKPNDSNVEDYLIDSINLSKKIGLKSDMCRALINYSNYLFMNFNRYDDSFKKIIEAVEISKAKYDYLYILSIFSLINLNKKNRVITTKEINGYKKEIISFIENRYIKTETISSLKDNRIINIVKFFLVNNEPKVKKMFTNTDNKFIKNFIEELKSKEIKYIENQNPYFKDNIYVTYY